MTAKLTYGTRWPVYAKQWDTMSINGDRVHAATEIAKKLIEQKARYQKVETITGVPWWVIAVIHQRESSQDWSASLAQGDPWNKVSRHVPRGRGPFKSWEDAAVDALGLDGLDRVVDWRLEKAAYYLERYNGEGYFFHGIPSPYLWGWSNIQQRGKYRSDGVWDPNQMDVQPGCMVMLKAMQAIDPTIQPVRES